MGEEEGGRLGRDQLPKDHSGAEEGQTPSFGTKKGEEGKRNPCQYLQVRGGYLCYVYMYIKKNKKSILHMYTSVIWLYSYPSISFLFLSLSSPLSPPPQSSLLPSGKEDVAGVWR